jgi:hypothetical protein
VLAERVNEKPNWKVLTGNDFHQLQLKYDQIVGATPLETPLVTQQASYALPPNRLMSFS